MKKLKNRFFGLVHENEGSVMILSAAFLLFAFALAGASIDFGRAQLLQMKQQQATDLAAIAAANIVGKYDNVENEAQIRVDTATRYYNLNFPASYLGTSRNPPTYVYDDVDDVITVSNSSSVSTSYLKNPHNDVAANSITVASKTKVNIPDILFPDFDVVIILDESASVSTTPPGWTKTISETEKDAVRSMISVLFPENQPKNPDLRFGLIGYAAAITHAFGLTSDKDQALDNVSKLSTYYQNYDHMALEAGYNMLNGIWNGFVEPKNCQAGTLKCIAERNTGVPPPSTERNDDKLVSNTKYAIFITDGLIMLQPGPCEGGRKFDNMPGDPCPNLPAFLRKCNQLKASGIVVYTINFYIQAAENVETMRSCASDPSKYFYAPTEVELTGILNGIATQAHSIRITD